MQANTITLAVDVLNNDTTEDHVFSRFDEYQNRTVYTEAIHQLTLRDTLSFYRTFPKASGNFRGTAKTTLKFSKDYAVDGVDGVASLIAPLIAEVSFSVPVGVSAANQMIARQRCIAILDDDDVMVALMNQLNI